MLDAAGAIVTAVVFGVAGFFLGSRLAGSKWIALGVMGAALALGATAVTVLLMRHDRTSALLALGTTFGVVEGVRLGSAAVFSTMLSGRDR
jgi:hypothetical protein